MNEIDGYHSLEDQHTHLTNAAVRTTTKSFKQFSRIIVKFIELAKKKVQYRFILSNDQLKNNVT